ncbi:MAG: hypothetical protein KDC80_30040, partial [Saprospiraceae bacterium]|nr:hypothetical protein [Saprospiraceae bacterium]
MYPYNYVEFKPHQLLRKYIDAYWMVEYKCSYNLCSKILPDGCIDIILNLGTNLRTDARSTLMRNEQAYLVGTMTRFKENELQPDTKLLGIRFR